MFTRNCDTLKFNFFNFKILIVFNLIIPCPHKYMLLGTLIVRLRSHWMAEPVLDSFGQRLGNHIHNQWRACLPWVKAGEIIVMAKHRLTCTEYGVPKLCFLILVPLSNSGGSCTCAYYFVQRIVSMFFFNL